MTFWDMPECLTCELIVRRDAGGAPEWDRIQRTPHWDVVHAFGTSVEGWIVLVLRRHAAAVADLTDPEAAELGSLLRDVSAAVQSATGSSKTYIAQFAEHPQHPHVHFHVIPREPNLDHTYRGPGIFQLLGLPEDECLPEARMTHVARAVAGSLAIRP